MQWWSGREDLFERLRKREAYHQAAEKIRADQSFSRVIRRVAAESLRLQQNHHPDEGSVTRSGGKASESEMKKVRSRSRIGVVDR